MPRAPIDIPPTDVSREEPPAASAETARDGSVERVVAARTEVERIVTVDDRDAVADERDARRTDLERAEALRRARLDASESEAAAADREARSRRAGRLRTQAGLEAASRADAATMAEEDEVRRRAPRAASTREGRAGVVETGERVEEVVETERVRAGAPGRGRLHRAAPSGAGMSAYYSRLAAREAEAEDVPLTVWLEQAILERARGRARSAGREEAADRGARPAVAAVEEDRRERDVWFGSAAAPRGNLLAALVLGAVLGALLLLLIPSSCASRSGGQPPVSFVALQTATTAAAASAAAPNAPAAPGGPAQGQNQTGGAASPPGAVTVTTIIDGLSRDRPERVRTHVPPSRPPGPLRPAQPAATDCNCVMTPSGDLAMR